MAGNSNNQELENVEQTVPESAPSAETNLASAIAESQAVVNEASLEPPKKRRGRRKKSEIDAANAANEAANSGSISTIGQGTHGVSIPPGMLKPVIEFPFRIAAARTGYTGFALDSSESESISPLLDQCVNQYAPTVAGPHAAALMLGAMLVMTAGMKYLTYVEWKRDEIEKRKAAARAEILRPHAEAANFPTMQVN